MGDYSRGMEEHPSYPSLKRYLQAYPRSRSSIYQAYNDIVYGQQWSDISVADAPRIKRAIISGKRPEQEIRSFVIPCGLEENISTSWLAEAFTDISATDGFEVYLGISSNDSSIVYYKISQGIVKPSN